MSTGAVTTRSSVRSSSTTGWTASPPPGSTSRVQPADRTSWSRRARWAPPLGLGTSSIPPGWDRLLHGLFGRDDAWMLIPSVVAAAGLLVLTRRRAPDRRPPGRHPPVVRLAGPHVGLLQQGRYLNSYYLAALIPRRGRALRPRSGDGLAPAASRRGPGWSVLADHPRQHGVRHHAGSHVRRRPVRIIASLVVVSALAVADTGRFPRAGHASPWAISCGLGLAALARVRLGLGQRFGRRRRRGPLRHALPTGEDHVPQPGVPGPPGNAVVWPGSSDTPTGPTVPGAADASSRRTLPAFTSLPPGAISSGRRLQRRGPRPLLAAVRARRGRGKDRGRQPPPWPPGRTTPT